MNWRNSGRIIPATWVAELRSVNSPMLAEWDTVIAAAGDLSGLLAAMAWHESQYGTAFNANVPENRNPLNLRPRGGGGGFVKFVTFTDCAKEWRARLLDPGYAYAHTTTIADLIHVYAPSSDGNNEAAYVAAVEAKLARWAQDWGVQPVTTPTIYNLSTDYARYGLTRAEANEVIGSRFENRAHGGITVSKPEFIVLHIQAGYTKGSLKYWSSPSVDASSTVMIQHDGSILNIIPEQHAPWTNGDDANPSAAGQRLVNLPGNSNLYTLSIESEGVDGTDTTPAQLDSIVWQVETWMAKYGIPKANVLRHADINSVTRPNCPGAYYPLVMARIGATPPGPVYASPEVPAWFAASVQQAHPSDANVDGVRWFVLRRNFEALRNTNRYSKPDTSSPKSGPKILVRDKIVCERYFKDANKRSWVVEPDGSYVTAASFTPAVTIRSR